MRAEARAIIVNGDSASCPRMTRTSPPPSPPKRRQRNAPRQALEKSEVENANLPNVAKRPRDDGCALYNLVRHVEYPSVSTADRRPQLSLSSFRYARARPDARSRTQRARARAHDMQGEKVCNHAHGGVQGWQAVGVNRARDADAAHRSSTKLAPTRDAQG